MKIYGEEDIIEAANEIQMHGCVAIHGTNTIAENIFRQIKHELKSYDIELRLMNFPVKNHGWLHCIANLEELSLSDTRKIVEKVDKYNPV